jgi:hypothetical protein
LGLGWLAFTAMAARVHGAALEPASTTGTAPLDAKRFESLPHFSPRAKRVIFLFMDGGVSQVDSFDPKPELDRLNGQPAKWRPDPKSQSVSAGRKWLGSPWKFARHGQSGLWVSELFPHAAKMADELCVVRSMIGETPLHGAQSLLLHTGRSVAAAPSIGSWVSYGLAREDRELPGYVLLNNDWIPNGGFQNFASSFLPANHQAALVRAKGTPVDNIVAADPADVQREKLAFLREADTEFARSLRETSGATGSSTTGSSTTGSSATGSSATGSSATGSSGAAAAIEASIRNYETAARMQMLVPSLCDVAGETAETLALYGVDRGNDYEKLYALQCLRARRFAEAGVGFIEVTCPNTHGNNSPWDQHGDLRRRHAENARITDQPVAALLIDLKRRGLLDETLVVWAGEMGRTPHSSGTDGRDHHVSGYSIWMAGGGVRGGMAYGATDEMGMSAIENPLDIHDLHATILHLLGLDHERLTFRFGGRDMRLTDVHGRVIRDLLLT